MLRRKLFIAVLALFASTSQAGRVLEPKDFDRLDGHGPTAKKVDVIEWEGNLEIHVYPQGSLKSLGMKIDRESKVTKNSVMVIEYAFHGVPYTLIRRAVLSIKLPDTFKTFRDESADGYDKIIVSGNGLAGVSPYALAPPPTQLFPDYHPSLAQDEPAKAYPPRQPSGIQFKTADEVNEDARGTSRKRKPTPSEQSEDGAIKSFAF